MLPLIITVRKKDQIKTLEVNKEAFSVGRSLDCDVQVNENSISRIHAIVTIRENQMWIEDRNSSNGTFLNGEEIVKGQPVPFDEGDELLLGTSGVVISVNYTHEEVEAEEEPEASAAPVAEEDISGDDSGGNEVAVGDEVKVIDDVEEVAQAEEDQEEADEEISSALGDVAPPENDRSSEVFDDFQEEMIPPKPEESIEINKESVAEPVVDSSDVKGRAPVYMAEKVLLDAKKRAAQIVLESEAEAARKVQSIYEKARKTQEQAELFYEQRIAEAHASADLILEDFQKQGQELLREARNMSDSLREEVDSYIEALKKKAKIEADEIVSEAIKQADKIQIDARIAGQEKAKKENESLVRVAQEEAASLMDRTQKEVASLIERTQKEVASFKEKAKKEAASFIEKTRREAASIMEIAQSEAASLKEKSQNEAESLLKKAEAEAATLMEKTEIEAESLQEKVQNETTLLREITENETALLKEKTQSEATLVMEKAQADAASIMQQAQEEAALLIEQVQKQVAESQEHLEKSQLKLSESQGHLAESQRQLASEKENFDKLMNEVHEAQEKLMNAQTEFGAILEKHQAITEIIEKEENQLGELKTAYESQLTKLRDVDSSIHILNEKHVNLTINIQDMEAKRSQMIKESESLKAHLTEKFEREKQSLLKAEEERSEEIRLEFAKKMKQMEQDLVDSVLQRKQTLIRGIHGAVEQEVVQLVDASKWRKISDTVQERIADAFDDKVASLSQSAAIDQKPDDLWKKRTHENLRWAAGGLVLGMALLFTTNEVLEKMRSDNSPMQTRVTNEAKQRQEDLELRRFNPPQTIEIRETYVDSVIYTRDFVAIYEDQEYQQRLYKEMAQYLLKTWRLDEEVSLRALSAVNALVKELVDKKSKIHPDFVKEGVEKMHKLEAETVLRLKEILGSEVRLESFRRFENTFYTEELKLRGLAQR